MKPTGYSVFCLAPTGYPASYLAPRPPDCYPWKKKLFWKTKKNVPMTIKFKGGGGKALMPGYK